MTVADPVADQVREIKELVARLIVEHRGFSTDVVELNGTLESTQEIEALASRFLHLQDGLTEHMVVEEFEFYPELVRRDLFDEEASEIMQQHHELTASLNSMEAALRLRNLEGFRSALEDLQRVLKVHQPAEEEKLFPLVEASQ